MRLIDADALIAKMPTVMDMQDTYLPIHFKEWLIDEAPTIEPKRGEWIHHEPFDKVVRNCEPCRECSCCHTWYQYDGIPRLNFCPNCGADMREREGE